jgi:hypothetical protein
MSKKINNKRQIENQNIPPQSNDSEAQRDTFSFLELNKFLANENKEKEHNNNKNKVLKKRSSYNKEEPEKEHKLKIKPNVNIAREQTSDDMMYIEKDDLNQKEEVEKEEKKEKKETNKEKNIPKKQEEKKKAKVDKRLVKLNLNKEKSEEKLKSKDKELNSDKKDKTSKEEKAEIYDIESFINKIKENDPQAYTPIMLPLEKDNTEEKSLKDELMEENEENKNKLFVFQFPRQIPIKDLNNQIKIKEEENVNEEPEYDQNGFLISPEFKNSFQEINNKTVIGKLLIMKSGKLKIKMGDIYFDVNQGCLTKFAQFATVITENKDNQAYILGQPLNKKLIVTPEFD